MDENPELNQSHKFFDMTRQEQMKDMMMRANAAYRLGKEKWFHKHEPHVVHWAYTQLGNSPIGLHYTMFLNACQAMMNDEQQKEWIPKVRNMEILGTYAQTEIGHGSDIAGLRTTATFDVEK
jgi:acyl-CoA oxidase